MKKLLVLSLSIGIALLATACQEQTTEPVAPDAPAETVTPATDPIPQLSPAPSTDWQPRQATVEQAILAEQGGGYTASEPLVLVNPYGQAPLTALLIFETEMAAAIDILIPGTSPETTFAHSFEQMQTSHQIPVYGLYGGQVNQIELTVNYEDNSQEQFTIPIETEPLPADLPPHQIIEADPAQAGGADGELLFIAAATDTSYRFAIDKAGDIRWYSANNKFSGGILRRDSEGKMLALSETMYAPSFMRSGLVQTDWFGRIYSEYLQDYTHHDVIEMPNGNYLMPAVEPNSTFVMGGLVMGADLIVELDRNSGEMVNSWDINTICGYTAEDLAEGLYLHINSVAYDASDDSIVLSSPTIMAVIKFSVADGEIIWAIGDPRRNYPEPIASKILEPIGDDFEWQGMQHTATVLGDGKFMLFDNGTTRMDAEGNPVADIDNYSRLVIYDIDAENMTIEQVYQYGKERGNAMYATYVGDVDYLGENHYLLNAGGRVVDENGIAQGSNLDVYMGIKRGETIIVEIKDGQVIFEVAVGGESVPISNMYRVEWFSLYADNEPQYDISTADNHRYGELLPSTPIDYQLAEETEPIEGEIMFNPLDYGFQLNIPLKIEGAAADDTLYVELKGAEQSYYYSTFGLTGAEAMIRASGIEPDQYQLGLVLIKADGTTQYYQSEYSWTIE